MKIYDDIYSWQGFGRKLNLGSGSCRLRIFDIGKDDSEVTFMKPIIVIVEDLPNPKLPVRSISGHIATRVSEDFDIDPSRMLWIEYYPPKTYGSNAQNIVSERFDGIEFEWHEGKAIHPKIKPLFSSQLEAVRELLESSSAPEAE